MRSLATTLPPLPNCERRAARCRDWPEGVATTPSSVARRCEASWRSPQIYGRGVTLQRTGSPIRGWDIIPAIAGPAPKNGPNEERELSFLRIDSASTNPHPQHEPIRLAAICSILLYTLTFSSRFSIDSRSPVVCCHSESRLLRRDYVFSYGLVGLPVCTVFCTSTG